MLDIYDLNFQYCNEKYGDLNSGKDNLPRKGVLLRFFSLLKGIFLYSFLRKKKKLIKPNQILFFAIADNEVNSLKPVSLKVDNSTIFGKDDFYNGYPLDKIYWFSLLFIPIVIFRYLICDNLYHKKSFKYAFDGFCIAYSSNFILRKYLLKLKPSKVVIANQLSVFHRSLAHVCYDLNIETVYIQHASLTEKFCDLNFFTTILLEGLDSLNKTVISGTVDKNIFLIGIPKFDKYFDFITTIDSVKSIGICTNSLDDFFVFSNLIKFLKEKLPTISLIIRPHPSDRRRSEWMKLAKINGCFFSDFFKEDSFDFIKTKNLILAGNSNIHLESVLLNIPSIYFDYRIPKLDFYGFAKNDLVFYASEFGDIFNYILKINSNSNSIRDRAKLYVDTVGTIFDGKSTELASKIILGESLNNCFNVSIDNFGNKIHRFKSI
jgi:hypothetical protein